jgi:inner membrane protein involved in colicin E2 resistance
VRHFTVAYRTRGTGSWRYPMTEGTGQVRNFKLSLDTDFPEVDFPAGTLSPTRQATSGGRWHGEWDFKSLVANGAIGLALPQRLNPGDLASKITFFAPVGLLFFFFVVAVLAAARQRAIHPLHYFLLGCAFFAFHLLFAYLVDHLSIGLSFGLASVVSVFLVVSYARLFVGWRFALREMAIAQLIYLVLFSFTFFWTGFTGLAITLGAIVTLFVIMQITGRVDWRKLDANKVSDRAPVGAT